MQTYAWITLISRSVLWAAITIAASFANPAWASHAYTCIWKGSVVSQPELSDAVIIKGVAHHTVRFTMRVTGSEKPKTSGRNDSSCSFDGQPYQRDITLIQARLGLVKKGQTVRVLASTFGDEGGSATGYTLL